MPKERRRGLRVVMEVDPDPIGPCGPVVGIELLLCMRWEGLRQRGDAVRFEEFCYVEKRKGPQGRGCGPDTA